MPIFKLSIDEVLESFVGKVEATKEGEQKPPSKISKEELRNRIQNLQCVSMAFDDDDEEEDDLIITAGPAKKQESKNDEEIDETLPEREKKLTELRGLKA